MEIKFIMESSKINEVSSTEVAQLFRYIW